MAFFIAFAILSAIAISSPLQTGPVNHWFIAGVVASSLVAPTISLVTRHFVLSRLRSQPAQKRAHLRVYLRCERLLTALWFVGSIVSVFAFQWRSIVRYNWGLDKAFLIDEILLLTPILAPWFVLWSVQHDMENWRRQDKSIGAMTERLQFAVSQARLLLGIVLAPLFVVSSYWDLNRLFLPGIDDSPTGWVTLIVPLIVLFAAYPVLLRHVWPTEPLRDTILQKQLATMSDSVGLSVRDILVWDTPSKLPNAAMTGLLPSLRYVFVTKALLENFTHDEIRATFAHELGHIRFHHNLLRMLAILLPVAVLGLGANGMVTCSSWLGFGLTTRVFVAHSALAPLLGFSLTIVYLVFAFGWFCRQLEHQADNYACGLLAKSVGRENAVGAYVALLDRLADGTDMDRCEWLHPSWNERKRLVRLSAVQRAG